MLLRIFTKLYPRELRREAEDGFPELYCSLPFAGTGASVSVHMRQAVNGEK